MAHPRSPTRLALEARWLHLTRDALPGMAANRDWPVEADHCFQRILLDAACGGRWYDHIPGRPAYAHAPDEVLAGAVALGEACLDGAADLCALNARSLAWRRAARGGGVASDAAVDPTMPDRIAAGALTGR